MYKKLIEEILKQQGRTDVQPRLVLAQLRSEHGTLDALSRAEFSRSIKVAVRLIDRYPTDAEALASTYSL